MTLIFSSDRFQQDPAQAGTHALVVGIGSYPYLEGGRHENSEIPAPGLSQLTSAPASAHAVSNWLLGRGPYEGSPRAGLNNPSAPLATVDILTSEDDSSSDIPSAERLIQAFPDWFRRCNSNTNNVAFLYVCGHGLLLGDLVLLASDFGEPAEANPWRRAISLDSISQGMNRCAAKGQFLFYDCCRTYLSRGNASKIHGVSVFDQLALPSGQAGRIIMHSTLEGASAWGPPGRPSYFAEALLGGFSGYGAEDRGSGWSITNYQLSKALYDLLDFDNKGMMRQFAEGQPTGKRSVFHVLTEPPLVRTRVRCEPDAHMPDVTFRLECAPDLYVHSGGNGPFEKDVISGWWEFEMQHVRGQHPLQTSRSLVTPPAFDKIFEVV